MESLDRKIILGTDIASFYVFHPDDLVHRLGAPLGWPSLGFACRVEFDSGTLVGFSTGGDGGFGLRLTTGELSVREKQWHAGSWNFRLQVNHGRVLIDNGDCLPNDDYVSEPGDDCWIDLPIGNYRVDVHAIDWTSEPGATDEDGRSTPNALSSYVIRFIPVAKLEEIEVLSDTPPTMTGLRDDPPSKGYDSSDHQTYTEKTEPLESDTFVRIETSNWLVVPGFSAEVPVSDAIYEVVFGSDDSTSTADLINEFALAAPGAGGNLAVLVQASGASKSDNGPWSMGFRGLRLARVLEKIDGGKWPKVRVQPLARADESPAPHDLAELKIAFAQYAATNAEYRKAIHNPDFDAEMVASMKSAEGVTNVLIHHIQIPDARREELLQMSNAARVKALSGLLKSTH